jgi:hypothetical protein
MCVLLIWVDIHIFFWNFMGHILCPSMFVWVSHWHQLYFVSFKSLIWRTLFFYLLTDKLCLLSTLKPIHRFPFPSIQRFSQRCKHPMPVMWGVALALRITSVWICNDGARFGFTRFVTYWFRSGLTDIAAVWWLSVCSVLFFFPVV